MSPYHRSDEITRDTMKIKTTKELSVKAAHTTNLVEVKQLKCQCNPEFRRDSRAFVTEAKKAAAAEDNRAQRRRRRRAPAGEAWRQAPAFREEVRAHVLRRQEDARRRQEGARRRRQEGALKRVLLISGRGVCAPRIPSPVTNKVSVSNMAEHCR